MREFAQFIMAGRSRAMLIAGLFGALSLIVLPMSYVSGAAAGLVALRKGIAEALLVMGGAAVMVVLATFVIEMRPGLVFPVVFALWIPVLVSAWVLRQTQSQGNMLLTIAGFSALFVIAMHLFTGDVVTWWEDWLKVAVTGVKGATVKGFERDDTLRLMNGFVAMIFSLSVALTLFLARWWQSLLYHPGGFAGEFQQLRIPRLALVAIVALLMAVGGFHHGMLVDLFMVSMALYLFQGLAVLHGIVAVRKLGWGWLVPPYLALSFVPQYVVMAMAFLGAVDAFIDFRKRASA